MAIHVNHVCDGWYEWKPNGNCEYSWLDMHQVVQVIEGMVWATGVRAEVSTREADKHGSFVRKIELSE